MSDTVAYIDGGSHGNPGPAGIGVVIQHVDGDRVELSECIGSVDNNYAEYAALLAVLRYALGNGCLRLRVYSDSQVVVRQINGHYTCQSPMLRQIYKVCVSLIESLDEFSLIHVRREKNSEANDLARRAIARAKQEKRLAARGLTPAFAD